MVATLGFGATAEAHTLYAGPARGTAAWYAGLVARDVNRDEANPFLATRWGATGCGRINAHRWRCGIYLLGYDVGTNFGIRCDGNVIVYYFSEASRNTRAYQEGEPYCR